MGLTKDANEKEIKIAYRRLARKYHPDVSKEKDAEERFKEIGEAYEVLRDPEKRKMYDQYMRDRASQQQRGHAGHYEHFGEAGSGFSGDQSSFDFFESLFGGGQGFHTQSPFGGDLQATIAISLEEAVNGAQKEIQLSGKSGVQTLRVKIPAGVRDGQQIRLSGQGAIIGPNGERGSLYLTLQIKKHPIFDVMGDDVYVTLPVAPWEVALGSTIVVPTLKGKVDLKIPANSQGGQKLRLKHRGLPGKNQGDQYVILKIVTPKPTTEAAKELYRKMAQEMPLNPRAHMGVQS